jgi:hypothetical protein
MGQRRLVIDLFGWGRPSERERRTRIRLCVAAYAYEVLGAPVMSDAAFDALALTSDPSITTGRFDEWWRAEFQPHTGQWIHTHPDLSGVARLTTSQV